MDEKKENIININGLTIGYSNKKILQNISFDVKKNEVVAILGLNGTGKSTLLRALCGLQPALSGKISINGINIKTFSAGLLAKTIGIVLPGRAEVLTALTVDEILSIARSPYTGMLHSLNTLDKEIISRTLNVLEIAYLVDRKIYELSDGEAQKVFIAKALVQESEIIVLDEPTSFLDVQNKILIFRLIKNLAEKKTIIFATHEIELAIQIADKCLLIREGKTVFDTTPNLISNDHFQLFFNNDHFQFNKLTQKFEIVLN